MPQNYFNEVMQLMHENCPADNCVPKNYLELKKKVWSFGLDVQTIDCCRNSCILYFKEDSALEKYKFCNSPRWKPKKSGDNGKKPKSYVKIFYFPLTPGLQRLYASRSTVEHMRWHYNNRREDGVLCHPSDGEVWKHFVCKHSDFAYEPRNVRLGLCVDGFTPFSQSAQPYSICLPLWHLTTFLLICAWRCHICS